MLFELELSEQCDEQPDDVDEEIDAAGDVTNPDTANRR